IDTVDALDIVVCFPLRRLDPGDHLSDTNTETGSAAYQRAQWASHLEPDGRPASRPFRFAGPRATAAPEQTLLRKHGAARQQRGPGHATYTRDLAAGVSCLDVVAVFIRAVDRIRRAPIEA